MFQPLRNDPSREPYKGSTGTGISDSNPNTWLLSRQPFMRFRLPVHQVHNAQPSKSSTDTYSPSPWLLWDNRFWLRVAVSASTGVSRAPDSASVVDVDADASRVRILIRPLQESDLKPILGCFDGDGSISLKKLLARRAPGHVRFTVPLVTAVIDPVGGSESGLGGEEIPLALPTILPSQLPTQNRWKVECEWMYKMVDTEVLESLGWPQS